MRAEKTIFIIFLSVVTLHLSLCLFVGFFPNGSVFGIRNLSPLYRIYAVPGPFFKEELIRSVPHFFLSYKTRQGHWSNWQNPEADNFRAYHEHPWRYNKLKQSVFERSLAKGLARKISEHPHENFLEFREFNKLHRYFADGYLPSNVDSVSSAYVMSYYNPQTRMIRSDTVFRLKYKSF